MAKKKDLQPPKNDFEYDEGEVYGFTDKAPIGLDVVSSFSFSDDSETQAHELNSEIKSNDNNIPKDNIKTETNTTEFEQAKNIYNSTKDIFDNRRTPLPNRATPPIDGETPTIKRTYTLRDSTIRKINELKNVHPDINVCVSSIVDIALDNYHNYILNEGGRQ